MHEEKSENKKPKEGKELKKSVDRKKGKHKNNQAKRTFKQPGTYLLKTTRNWKWGKRKLEKNTTTLNM